MRAVLIRVLKIIIRTISLLENRRKIQSLILLLIMILTAIFEVFTLSAVIPFLQAVIAPEILFENQLFKKINLVVGIRTELQLVIFLATIFGVAALVSGVLRMLLLVCQTRLGWSIGADLAANVFCGAMNDTYPNHIAKGSEETISAVTKKVDELVFSYVVPSVALMTSLLLTFSIVGTMVFIDPFAAIGAFLGFGSIYIGVALYFNKRLMGHSVIINRNQTRIFGLVRDGLGSMRDVIIGGHREFYTELFARLDREMKFLRGEVVIISAAPRYLLEGIALVIVAAIFVVVALWDGTSDAFLSIIPFLAALALSCQRLLPHIQQIYGGFTAMRGGEAAAEDALLLLE